MSCSFIRKALLFTVLLTALTSFSREAEAVPEIIAHRGASAAAPENTVASADLAWRLNADAV
jgi:glycerophosphoryl diester phosphodiesterase